MHSNLTRIPGGASTQQGRAWEAWNVQQPDTDPWWGQGHALFTRQAGSTDPCPLIDFPTGFNEFFALAYNLPPGVTVQQRFGAAFGARPSTWSSDPCRASPTVEAHCRARRRRMLLGMSFRGCMLL